MPISRVILNYSIMINIQIINSKKNIYNMYPTCTITTSQQSVTGQFFFAKTRCLDECLMLIEREPNLNPLIKNYLRSNIASVENGHFIHGQLASGRVAKIAEDIWYRMKTGANTNPVCGTITGANWARRRADNISICIIDAFMNSREF
jgi:hypothetical protein